MQNSIIVGGNDSNIIKTSKNSNIHFFNSISLPNNVAEEIFEEKPQPGELVTCPDGFQTIVDEYGNYYCDIDPNGNGLKPFTDIQCANGSNSTVNVNGNIIGGCTPANESIVTCISGITSVVENGIYDCSQGVGSDLIVIGKNYITTNPNRNRDVSGPVISVSENSSGLVQIVATGDYLKISDNQGNTFIPYPERVRYVYTYKIETIKASDNYVITVVCANNTFVDSLSFVELRGQTDTIAFGLKSFGGFRIEPVTFNNDVDSSTIIVFGTSQTSLIYQQPKFPFYLLDKTLVIRYNSNYEGSIFGGYLTNVGSYAVNFVTGQSNGFTFLIYIQVKKKQNFE